MKILFLSHRIPYPPNKGDKIRSFNEIKYLSKHHIVDIACLADNPTDLKFEKDLKEFCRKVHVTPFNPFPAKIKGVLNLLSRGSISVGYFYSRMLQQVIDQWLFENTYDAIICFSSPMAEYLFRSNTLDFSRISGAPHPRFIMDFCDVDSDKWRQYAGSARFPLDKLYKTEFQRLLAYERKITQTFDHSVFVSHKEAELYKTLAPEARNISVMPNGVDSDYFSPEAVSAGTPSIPLVAKPQQLMFSGAMDYHANIDGVTWFSREIFPQLRNHFSNLKFIIVGSNPTSNVKALANGKNIQVTGFVEDIRPYYAAADICVIPLRMARGVQNKVLEAMSMGKAIVSTSAAIQGITAQPNRQLLVADTPEAFSGAITELLADNEKRKRFGIAARDFVKTHYSWNTGMAELNALLAIKAT